MIANDIVFESFPAGPLQCNCTLIAHKTAQEGIVIDPGGDLDRIMAFIKKWQLTQIRVVHTHAHFDHILAAGALKEKTGARLGLHRGDKLLWDNLDQQCRLFGVPCDGKLPPPDDYLQHEEDLSIVGLAGKVLHTPGHTPGSLCFLFSGINLLVAGDTLFQGGIGRTDLWGGDYQQIEVSIKEVLYKLDEGLDVITGHGPQTRIGTEMRHNAFIRG